MRRVDLDFLDAGVAGNVEVFAVESVGAFGFAGRTDREVLQLVEIACVEEIPHVLFADLEDHVLPDERGGGRAEILVGGRVRVREVVQQVQGGSSFKTLSP